MQLADDLETLVEVAVRRLTRLRVLTLGFAHPVTPSLERQMTYVVIETYAIWANFTRHYYLSTALRARHHGSRVALTVMPFPTADAALTHAVHVERPSLVAKSAPWSPRDEPVWHDATVFTRLIGGLGASNVASVQAGVSYQPSSVRDVVTFRNFFAHKSRIATQKAKARARPYAISPSLRPTEILVTNARNRPQPLVRDLIDDLVGAVQLMV